MIQLNRLNKTYKTTNQEINALCDVNLTIEKGQIYGIIGLSGAGKSTLVRLINGLETATSGRVFIKGQDITNLSKKDLNQKRKSIGMIFQHFNLLSSRNVYKNIALPLELVGRSSEVIEHKVNDLLKKVGLEDKRNAQLSALSGGQKQRVAIARALVLEPEILLCDEATSALDPKTTQEILELIQTLRDDLNLTVVLITHEMSVIKKVCDKVAVLEDGQVVEKGCVIEIFNNPIQKITEELVKVG